VLENVSSGIPAEGRCNAPVYFIFDQCSPVELGTSGSLTIVPVDDVLFIRFDGQLPLSLWSNTHLFIDALRENVLCTLKAPSIISERKPLFLGVELMLYEHALEVWNCNYSIVPTSECKWVCKTGVPQH